MAKNNLAAGWPGDSQMPEELALHPSLLCFPVSLSQRPLLRLRAAVSRYLPAARSRALLLLLLWVVGAKEYPAHSPDCPPEQGLSLLLHRGVTGCEGRRSVPRGL